MIESIIKATLTITAITGSWLVVQAIGARAAGMARGEDPLRGRLGCQGCDCPSRCTRSHEQQPGNSGNRSGTDET